MRHEEEQLKSWRERYQPYLRSEELAAAERLFRILQLRKCHDSVYCLNPEKRAVALRVDLNLKLAEIKNPQSRQIAETLIDYLCWLCLQGRDHPKLPVLSTRDFLEIVLNALVYDEVFNLQRRSPDSSEMEKLPLAEVIRAVEFKPLASLPEETRLRDLCGVFEALYDSSHPVRGATWSMFNYLPVRAASGHL